MRLFDTRTRELRPIKPLDGSTYRFYCCGPTVYGPAHIGNFRTFVLQDVFRRVLELSGQPTLHVRNITDVDDKTIRDSQKAGQTLAEFTAGWTARFHADCAALGCLPPHIEPAAAAHIPHQIAMIEALVEKGHAYAGADGSVYFRIASFPEYGGLSRLDQRDLELGKTQNARANADEYEKDSIADFALWKARKPEDGENFWPSPWGEGRPGWHLECSAMIREYLGTDFDLHSGGVDLVFPHHENEIAQSRCACGGHFAAHWFHITHLLVDGGKMSKSLGNLYTLDDLAARGHTPMETRYVLIGAHYRRPLNFTLDSLKDARAALARLARFGQALATAAGKDTHPCYEESTAASEEGGFSAAWASLRDDLNTPEALGHLFSAIKSLRPSEMDAASAKREWLAFHRLLAAFGLTLPSPEEDTSAEIPSDIAGLAEERWQARLAKDWAKSDILRQQLADLGWVVKDGKEGYQLTRA
jgi:cysteinyl-tRNA synthetase